MTFHSLSILGEILVLSDSHLILRWTAPVDRTDSSFACFLEHWHVGIFNSAKGGFELGWQSLQVAEGNREYCAAFPNANSGWGGSKLYTWWTEYQNMARETEQASFFFSRATFIHLSNKTLSTLHEECWLRVSTVLPDFSSPNKPIRKCETKATYRNGGRDVFYTTEVTRTFSFVCFEERNTPHKTLCRPIGSSIR